EPIIGQSVPQGGMGPDPAFPPSDPFFAPPGQPPAPVPSSTDPSKRETLPQPRTITPPRAQPAMPPTTPPTTQAPTSNPVRITDVSTSPGAPPVPWTAPGSPGPAMNSGQSTREKETQGWNGFRRDSSP